MRRLAGPDEVIFQLIMFMTWAPRDDDCPDRLVPDRPSQHPEWHEKARAEVDSCWAVRRRTKFLVAAGPVEDDRTW